MSSLREELEKRLLQDMIASCRGGDKALVLNVDHHTSKILSSSARMYDVMETGVIVVENIFLARQKLALPAIYFVQPTTEIVDRLLHDFSDKYQQYGAAHVFFTETVPTALMQRLNSSTSLVKHLKTLVELNADFISLESYAFSCNRDPATVFSRIFSSNSSTVPATANTELESISRQVASVCLTMHEYPYVRYAQNSNISKSIAQMFEREMNECMRKMSNWKYSETRERGTILFLDRSVDPTAPLMHEFTFQAMIYDLVRNRGEICYLPANTKKTVLSPRDEKTENGKEEKENYGIVLGEDDSLWCEFRHKHISTVMTTLKKKFEEFTNKNALVKLQREQEEKKGASAMKDMNKAVKDLAVYKETMRKYEKHMGLAEYCMTVFQNRNLKGLGDVEQDIATGIDDEGRKVDEKKAKEELLQMCNDQHIRALEKIRLVLIYMINWGGLSSSVHQELLNGINPILQSCVREITKFNVNINTNSTGKTLISKDRQAEFQARNHASQLILMRFIPVAQGLMEHLVQFNLNEDQYPYLTPPPEDQRANMQAKSGKSVRRRASGQTHDWKSSEKHSEDDKKPRFYVFVVGGITLSEIRAAYEIAEQNKVQIYIGGTSVLQPNTFLQGLSGVSAKEWVSALVESDAGEEWEEEAKALKEEENARREAEEKAKSLEQEAQSKTVRKKAPAQERPTGCFPRIKFWLAGH